jgi:predicted RNase H-like HicB family nuclease
MPKNSATVRSNGSAFEIRFAVQVWKENGTYVGYAPSLDVSSCGNSVREATSRLREAVSLFLEEAAKHGSLKDVLAEAGFEKHGRTYEPPRVLAKSSVRLAIPIAS